LLNAINNNNDNKTQRPAAAAGAAAGQARSFQAGRAVATNYHPTAQVNTYKHLPMHMKDLVDPSIDND
jgi:hypothetical protein